jgi:hypothetical protein
MFLYTYICINQCLRSIGNQIDFYWGNDSSKSEMREDEAFKKFFKINVILYGWYYQRFLFLNSEKVALIISRAWFQLSNKIVPSRLNKILQQYQPL